MFGILKWLVKSDLPLFQNGQEKAVMVVKLADNLVDVYIIEEKAFYHYNFTIISALRIKEFLASWIEPNTYNNSLQFLFLQY